MESLITNELNRAREKHPRQYASAHEGYAIVLEEFEELQEEMNEFSDRLKNYWDAVRRDDVSEQRACAHSLRSRSKSIVREAVQVSATIQRLLEDIKY